MSENYFPDLALCERYWRVGLFDDFALLSIGFTYFFSKSKLREFTQ